MDAALGYTADTVPALPPVLHLLGARKDALPLLGQVSLPVSHSLAKLAQTGPDGARMAAAQAAASDFGALCRANPALMGGIYRQKISFDELTKKSGKNQQFRSCNRAVLGVSLKQCNVGYNM